MANGYPSKNKGGGEKIIYLLAEHYYLLYKKVSFLSREYVFDFSSEFFEKKYLIKENWYKKIINKLLSNKILIQLYYFYPFFRLLFWIKKKYFRNKKKFVQNFDIIHAHDPIALFLIPKSENQLKILTLHSKISFVIELQNKYKFISKRVICFLKEVEKASLDIADHIVFPSRAAMEYAKEYFESLDSSKIKIIYNGIGLQEKINYAEKYKLLIEEIRGQYDIIVLNVANHIHEKRIDVLLNIIKELKKRSIKVFLINIGKGYLTFDLRQLAKQLGIEKNVIFLGTINNNDVRYLMLNTDFFVMTSEKVVFDLVILEALACRCRILCNEDGGNKEIITNKYNGYLIKENNVELYCNFIIDFSKDILNNTSKSLQKFSLHNMVCQYLELYSMRLESE